MPQLNDYLTVEQIAAEMELDASTIRGYTTGRREPKLPAGKLGGKLTIVSRADYETWKVDYQKRKDDARKS